MAIIRIFSAEDNAYYNINVDFYTDFITQEAPFSFDFNLRISTTMLKDDGTALPSYNVRHFNDFPNNGQRAGGGTTPYTTFTELINDYILYYMEYSGQYMSSSSSSSEQYSSSSSSSSTSMSSLSSSSSSSS